MDPTAQIVTEPFATLFSTMLKQTNRMGDNRSSGVRAFNFTLCPRKTHNGRKKVDMAAKSTKLKSQHNASMLDNQSSIKFDCHPFLLSSTRMNTSTVRCISRERNDQSWWYPGCPIHYYCKNSLAKCCWQISTWLLPWLLFQYSVLFCPFCLLSALALNLHCKQIPTLPDLHACEY